MLYKHIIKVENKNVGLKVGGRGTNIPLPPPPPPIKQVWGGGGNGMFGKEEREDDEEEDIT